MADLTAHADVTFGGTATGNVSFVTWETTARGQIQAKLEEVVGLLDRSDLLARPHRLAGQTEDYAGPTEYPQAPQDEQTGRLKATGALASGIYWSARSSAHSHSNSP